MQLNNVEMDIDTMYIWKYDPIRCNIQSKPGTLIPKRHHTNDKQVNIDKYSIAEYSSSARLIDELSCDQYSADDIYTRKLMVLC